MMIKKILHFLFVVPILFSACQAESDNDSTKKSGDTPKEKEIDISKFEEMAVSPCDLLTEGMVSSRFDVKSEDLDLDQYHSAKGKISWTSYCTYSWKKPNFEEIQNRVQEKILAAMKTGDTKNSVNVAMNIEKAQFEVGITNITIYKDDASAIKLFNQSHIIPEKEEISQLNESIDEQSEDNISDKEMGKDMIGGIANNLKFDKIEGIGTLAYWDFLGGKLDVLYGTIQIGIIMHISENHDENVSAAKDLAEVIMDNF